MMMMYLEKVEEDFNSPDHSSIFTMPAPKPVQPAASTSKSADALDDEFEIDEEFAADSPAGEEFSASGDEAEGVESDAGTATASTPKGTLPEDGTSKKRKRKESQKEAKVWWPLCSPYLRPFR
jgi:hypothetical protein